MFSAKNMITILGSGPAGMAAAINLAKHGYDIAVYESKDKPGAHFHNGWQILENYSSQIDALHELEAMNIMTDFYYKPESEIEFFDSRLQRFSLTGKKPFGYFLRRGSYPETLDTALYHQAENAGVVFHLNSKIDRHEADIISGGSVQATGIAKEVVFESDADDTLMTILDNYLTPLGFAYLFIINGHGTIGSAVLRDFRHIDEFTESVILRFRQAADFTIKNPRESVSTIGFFIPKTAIEDGKLFIGEAAGFQDYLFGLGIRRSIQSGYCAARSIITGENYDTLWRKQFGAHLTGSVLNRFFFETCGNTGITYLLRLARHLDFQKTGFYLQNPSFLRKIMAHSVKFIWRTKGTCKHGERCAWCRSR